MNIIIQNLEVSSYFLPLSEKLQEYELKKKGSLALSKGIHKLEKMYDSQGVSRWAIRTQGYVVNNLAELEDEPMPSARDEDFFKRCRFENPAEALKVWKQYLMKQENELAQIEKAKTKKI